MSLTRPRSLPAVLVALVLALWPSAATAAGDPPPRRPTAPEILEQALTKFGESVAKAEDRIDTLAERGEFRIERAIDKGASEASIRKIASKAKAGFSGQARKALAQINRDLASAMIRMRTADEYTPELEDDLRFAREEAIAELEDAVDAAAERIDEAIGDGGE